MSTGTAGGKTWTASGAGKIINMITVSKVITHVALVQKWVNDLLTRPFSEGVVGRSHTRARAEGGSRKRVARSDPVIILVTPIS